MMSKIITKEIKDLNDADRPGARKWSWILKTLLLRPDEIQVARELLGHASISQNSGQKKKAQQQS
jgi:hypothetical protein